MANKRIAKEFAELSQDPPDGFTLSLPASQTLQTWQLVLAAPPSTPFHSGHFGLLLTLPDEYPFKPPALRFVTRIYHPNVTDDSLGNVCLALLKPEQWKPSTKLRAVLDAVRALLLEPQPDDSLEERIAELYRSDYAAWEANARRHVQRFALAKPTFPEA